MSMEQEFITYLNGWLVKHCTTAVDDKTIADLAYFFNAGAEAQRKEAERCGVYKKALERIVAMRENYDDSFEDCFCEMVHIARQALEGQ